MRKSNQGFTLIEILIVILIIGITFGFALLAFGDFGEGRRILFSAEQLVNTMRLAQQQAILETRTLGLHIDNTSYQILQLQNNARWTVLSNAGIFRRTSFPDGTVVTLKTNTRTPIGSPAIIIGASGDMTPFTLKFSTTNESDVALLTGKRNGDLNLTKVSNK